MAQPRTLGFIGCGVVGSAAARLAVAAGLDVLLSNSRGPESLAGLVAELGPQARATVPAEAAGAADLVVVAIPLNAYDRLPAAELAGRTVIDLMNYQPERHGRIADLESGELTSSALVQRHLAASRVVKVFNDIDVCRLRDSFRLPGATDRITLLVAGDDEAAKAEVTLLLNTLGYDALDVGTLADSRVFTVLAEAVEQVRTALRAMAGQRGHAVTSAPGDGCGPVSEAAPRCAGLSLQEQRIMKLLASGRSVPEAAQEMCLSTRTVRNYLSRVYRKLGVRSQTQATLRWLGYVDASAPDAGSGTAPDAGSGAVPADPPALS